MLTSYLILPFIFAILIGISTFLKNPIYIRKIGQVFCGIQFIFSLILLFFTQNPDSGIELNEYNKLLMFISSLIFFLFSIISKNFILKLHRTFFATSFLWFGLINFALIVDNIFVLLIVLFWLFLIKYFLSRAFCEKNLKKDIKLELTNSILWLFVGTSLICKDFIRYFLINDISLDFSKLTYTIYKIDDSSVILAFFGFLIIIFKLFNLIPFASKNYSLSNQNNVFINSLGTIWFLILGSSLFMKCYTIFDYLFYDFEDIIAIFLILNFLAYLILLFKQKYLFKFLTCTLSLGLIIGIFSIFSFEDSCKSIFSYYSISLILSYTLLAIIFTILKDKFKTDKIDEFKKITDNSKITQIFICLSLLNIASVPFFTFFTSEMLVLGMIFSTDYERIILNIIPYILILGIFGLSLVALNILYGIIIAPIEKPQNIIAFSNSQIIVCIILAFAIIAFGICPQYIINVL